ncbi:MAG: DUF1902 domain-containing protein [Oscillospiraceae bacterium]|nr:DUF1902 domain-containing protein [Oscillospiraceae bacterium]
MNYYIDVNRDETAGVWYAVCDDIPVALESDCFETLITKVKTASYEILEMNKKNTSDISLCFKAIHWENIA